MDPDLILPEHSDQSFICPSIFIYIICTNTHLEKVVSVSKIIQIIQKKGKKDPEMCLFHVLVADVHALTLFCHYLLTESNSNFFSSLLLDLLERYVGIHLSPSPTRACQAFGFS